MKLAHLLVAVQDLSLDNLEALQVIVNGRVTSLQSDGEVVAKSKRQAMSVADAFAKEGLSLVPKPRGRQPDPNSAAGKVRAAVQKALAHNPEGIHIDHLFPQVAKETGLSLAVCKVNAMQIKGVIRNYGHWKKAA